jgi:hypothetical protein
MQKTPGVFDCTPGVFYITCASHYAKWPITNTSQAANRHSRLNTACFTSLNPTSKAGFPG